MNGATAVQMVQARLGKRTGMDTDVLNELQLAQTELEGGAFLPWFLFVDDQSSNVLGIGSETVPAPANFLRPVDNGAVYLLNPNPNAQAFPPNPWIAVKRRYDYAAALLRYSGQTLPLTASPTAAQTMAPISSFNSPIPAVYVLQGFTFYFVPALADTASSSLQLRLRYYGADTPIANNLTTNKWLTYAPDLLIAKVVTKLAPFYIQKPTEVVLASAAIEKQAMERLMVANVAWEQADLTATMSMDRILEDVED